MNKLVVAIALSALLTSCGTAENTEPANDAATTTTRTPRITDDSGRPDITFDPCLDIPNDLMNAAGYNAAKKKLADLPMGDYTFLGCDYDNRRTASDIGYFSIFTILAGNVTLQEEFEKNADVSQPTTINDRPALFRVVPDAVHTCTYVLETNFGIVILRRLIQPHTTEESTPAEWCHGVAELISEIEPFIAD